MVDFWQIRWLTVAPKATGRRGRRRERRVGVYLELQQHCRLQFSKSMSTGGHSFNGRNQGERRGRKAGGHRGLLRRERESFIGQRGGQILRGFNIPFR